MTVLRANFSSGSVQENPLAAGATTLTMVGNLQNLPTVAGGDFARLTIDPLGTDGLSGSGTEIVHVTAYTHGAGSATILRGQEGTTDRPHSKGVKIVNAPTVQDWTDVITQHEAESDPHSQYATDGDLSSHAAATTGVHGVGGSTIESAAGSAAKVAAHAAAGDPHPVYATDADLAAHTHPVTWHVVGAGGEPAFTGGASNNDSNTVAFAKDVNNIVHLRGHVSGGINQTVFTLPAGYRPAGLHRFASVNVASTTTGIVEVGSDGSVFLVGGASGMSLDGMTFGV